MTDFDFVEAEVLAEVITRDANDVVSDIYSQNVAPSIYAEKVRGISNNGELLTSMLETFISEHRYDKEGINESECEYIPQLLDSTNEAIHYGHALKIAVDNGNFSTAFFTEMLNNLNCVLRKEQALLRRIAGK